MRRFFYVLAFFTLIYGVTDAQTYPQRKNTYRLLSYNIHHGEGMDKKMDVERIGKLILQVNPEVAGLQEVDSMVRRSGQIDILKLLAEQTGMHPTFGYSILYDGGKYGNGILTREKPRSVKKIALPGEKEARTALIVELDRYVVVNTHLSLNHEERIESAKMINKAVRDFHKPVFLMGDLNATPGSEPMEIFKKEWKILSDPGIYTSPSVEPKVTLDYILGYTSNGRSFKTTQKKVIEEKIASDHRPLFVDVRIK